MQLDIQYYFFAPLIILFNFLLLICIKPPQSVSLQDCLYIFLTVFHLFAHSALYILHNYTDLCNPPLCLDLAEMNFSLRLSNHFSNISLCSEVNYLCFLDSPHTLHLEMSHSGSDSILSIGSLSRLKY